MWGRNLRPMKLLLAALLLTSTVLADPASLKQADDLYRQGKLDEVQSLAEQELRTSPQDLHAKLLLAKVALGKNDLATAQVYAGQLLQASPKSADYNGLRGLLFVLQNQAPQSLDFLEKSLEYGQVEKKPPDQMASFSNTLVTALHQAGQTPAALQRCLEFLKLYPANPELHLSASRLYRERKDYQNALLIAQQGLKAAPEFSSLYASVALAEAGLGHKDLSEQAYQKLLRADPDLAAVVRRVLDGTRKDSAELQVDVK